MLGNPDRGKRQIERDADVMDMVCEQGRLGKRRMAETQRRHYPALRKVIVPSRYNLELSGERFDDA